jgi:hypothetical protein
LIAMFAALILGMLGTCLLWKDETKQKNVEVVTITPQQGVKNA